MASFLAYTLLCVTVSILVFTFIKVVLIKGGSFKDFIEELERDK